MSKTRLLPAALLVVVPLAGCAAGQKDATSREHPTPWVANAQVGTVDVRNVVVTPASPDSGTSPSPADTGTPGALAPSASASPSAPAPSTSGSVSQPQGYLTLALLSSKKDTLTGASITGVPGATVTPTDSSATFDIVPNEILSISDPLTANGGGPSLAISGLPTAPVVGTTIQVTLQFQYAGQVTVTAPVRDLAVA